jgi:hypothetical protein
MPRIPIAVDREARHSQHGEKVFRNAAIGDLIDEELVVDVDVILNPFAK